MKKLLTIALLLISFSAIAQTVGIKVGTPIIKNAPPDNTITGYANLLNGGYHIVTTYHGRDSLTTSYSTTLQTGMVCYVSGVDSTYRWSGTAWGAVVSGGGTTTFPLTVNNSGAGTASPFTFDGSVARTLSYNSIGAQAALGFTPENVANKATNFGVLNNTLYPTTQAVVNYISGLPAVNIYTTDGVATGPRLFDLNGNSLFIDDVTNNTTFFETTPSTTAPTILFGVQNNSGQGGNITFSKDGARIATSDGVNLNTIDFNNSGAGLPVTDGIGKIGFNYGGDYSINQLNAGIGLNPNIPSIGTLGFITAAGNYVNVATTGALAANTYNNGTSGRNASITMTATGALVIDGVTLAVNTLVLVKNEATQTHNGVYIVTNDGSFGQHVILQRGLINDEPIALQAGSNVYVTQGTANTGLVYYQTTAGTVTIGTTNLVYATSGGGTGVTSVSGTTNRITSTGGTTPVIDISASYVGQGSITTLGTITTGIWNGTAIANANLANSTISGISLGSNLANLTATDATLTFSGSYNGGTARTVGITSSVALAGSPTTTTQTVGDNSTKIATTAFVQANIPVVTGFVPYTGASSNVNLGANFLAAGASLTPLTAIHAISTVSTNPRGILSDQNTADAVGARITMRKSRGTPGTPTVITTGDVLGSWTAAGYTNAYTDAGKVLVTSTGTISNGVVPAIMELQTANAAGTLTDGIKIDQSQLLTFGAYGTGLMHSGASGAQTSSLLVNADITANTITGASIASSVALAGSPTTTTQSALDNSTKIATTAYADALGGDNALKGLQAIGSPVKAYPVAFPFATTNGALTSQVCYFIPVYLATAQTITGVKLVTNIAGSYTGNNFNGVGLCSVSGGTLTNVATSSNTANTWTGSGLITVAFTGTYSAAPGLYYIEVLWSSSATTTAPSLGMFTTSGAAVSAFFGGTNKYGGTTASNTTLPTSIASSSFTTASSLPYAILY